MDFLVMIIIEEPGDVLTRQNTLGVSYERGLVPWEKIHGFNWCALGVPTHIAHPNKTKNKNKEYLAKQQQRVVRRRKWFLR
jgi:hypothetical protein